MATALQKYGTSDSGNKNLLEAQQSNGEVSANTLLKLITAFASTAIVIDKRSTPPGSPAELDIYRVGSSPTGDWSAFDEDDLAIFIDGAWYEWDPIEGVTILQKDTNALLTYNGTAWQEGIGSVSTAVSAAGTTQGGATALVSKFNEVTTVVAASAEGVRLPGALAGLEIVVINADAADTLKLYPASGDDIDGGATDASIDVTAGQVASVYAVDTTSWYSQVV